MSSLQGLFEGCGGRDANGGSAFWRYSSETMRMEMLAMRDLKAGEEVMHTCKISRSAVDFGGYGPRMLMPCVDIPLGFTLQERQLMLKPWGFECACSLCSASPREIAASDDRRERLFEIHQTLTSAAEEASLPRERIDTIVQEAMALIEAEGLQPLIEYLFVFARVYLSVNEVKLARKYAEVAEARLIMYEGDESAESEAINKLWKEIKELEDELNEDW